MSEIDSLSLPLRYWRQFLHFEESFDGQVWIDYTRDHAEIPILSVAVYLFFVFYVPEYLENKKPWKLKAAFASWNLFLALFSVIGVLRTVPHLYKHVMKYGFQWTVCTDPNKWYLGGAPGLWVGLFIYSKIPELLDTIFLVLQKKRVIFLAWFHHTTVLLYCWHAYNNRIGPGIWFACANYFVHSLMYTYYFLMAAKLHGIARPFAPVITTLQVLQMVLGSVVTVSSGYWHSYATNTIPCAVDPANFKLGFVMYASYFVLFTVLFWNKYLASPKPRSASPEYSKDLKERRSSKDIQMCGVDIGTNDASGFFHSSSKQSAREKGE